MHILDPYLGHKTKNYDRLTNTPIALLVAVHCLNRLRYWQPYMQMDNRSFFLTNIFFLTKNKDF